MDKKAEIKLVTQSVKGGKLSDRKKFGWMRIILGGRSWDNEDSIVIDGYYGAAISYAKRDQPNIKVESDGKVLFEGTYMQMCECLKLGLKETK